MMDSFKEMGTLGKIIAVLIVASAVKECAEHVAKTIKLRKEAGQ